MADFTTGLVGAKAPKPDSWSRGEISHQATKLTKTMRPEIQQGQNNSESMAMPTVVHRVCSQHGGCSCKGWGEGKLKVPNPLPINLAFYTHTHTHTEREQPRSPQSKCLLSQTWPYWWVRWEFSLAALDGRPHAVV